LINVIPKDKLGRYQYSTITKLEKVTKTQSRLNRRE
jgi:hypothetical protein